MVEWLQSQPLEILLNKKSTAWKGLTLVAQKKCNKEADAIKIIEATSNLIKRPVIEFGEKLLVGFDDAIYKTVIGTEEQQKTLNQNRISLRDIYGAKITREILFN